ncbi:helix-turn-helix transcriptional regulator [Hyphomicrobium sp. DY-1]|uniref:helix-turn-helix transcriptional regulator n=1 Tax=Hyphomicrobium sp. DY-1 TaxID=3075650 RepID=UPI0039C060F4
MPATRVLDKSVDRLSFPAASQAGCRQIFEQSQGQTTVRIRHLSDFPSINMLHTASYQTGDVERPRDMVCAWTSDIAPACLSRSAYALYLISGEITYGDLHCPATAGDLLVFWGDFRLASIEAAKLRALLLIVHELERPDGIADQFSTAVHISRHQLLAPLASCLAFIASRYSLASQFEYEMLYGAARGLIAIGLARSGQHAEPIVRSLGLQMLQYVDRELQDTDLDPAKVASYFGVSVRYVHKLFAQQGLTLGAYIRAKRLEQVHFELTAPGNQDQKIANIAKKWGFKDLSTFARAFREKYGCKPSEARSSQVPSLRSTPQLDF